GKPTRSAAALHPPHPHQQSQSIGHIPQVGASSGRREAANNMEAMLREWLGLLLRWTHIIAGIMWIGDSLLFMWIDSHLSPDPQRRSEVAGVTWLIHGGGYYHLEKRLL